MPELRTHALSSGEDVLVAATDQHIEAPNWTPDGRWLVVNCEGRIYRVPATGGGLSRWTPARWTSSTTTTC